LAALTLFYYLKNLMSQAENERSEV
jgi:hypothetical protein